LSPSPAPPFADPPLHKRLSDWVNRLLSTEPERRPQSAAEAWEELEEIVIDLLDPRWRREARLVDELDHDRSSPATPAHFVSQRVTMQTLVAVDPEFARTLGVLDRPASLRDEPVTRIVRRRSGRSKRAIATVTALPLVVLAGFLGARASDGGSNNNVSAQARVVSGGVVLSSLPHGWRIARSADAAVWLGNVRPSTIAAPREGSLAVGVVSATSAGLLPQRLLRSRTTAPARASVSLGGQAFYRYSPATLSNGSSAAVYTQPTTKGVLLAVCQLPGTSPKSVNIGCEQVLATAKLASGRSLPLEQSARWVDDLNRTTQTLSKARATLSLALSKAQEASRQAAVCANLAHAVRQAATALQAAAPGQSEQSASRELVSFLNSLRRGYQEMADGASRERSATYNRGRALVGSSSRELQAGLARLRTSG
jgi:hypothetical protein